MSAKTTEQIDKQNQALKKLKKENLDLSEELDYYKTKCASLETGLFQADKKNEQLKQSNNGAIELMLDGIVEMHDGKRDYAESIFNKAIKLLKGDVR